MAAQRKIFRIEERARVGAPSPVPAEPADGVQRHREFMAELQALRALIAPSSAGDRDALDRVRAQVAEAQAYKHELDLIYGAVKLTKAEIGAADADGFDGERIARVGRELQAIVAGTERATQSILQAAEEIEQTANTLSAALKNEHEKGLAQDIQDRVVQIFEACNFQDLTGQRVASVVAALKAIEGQVSRLQSIWRSIECFKPIMPGELAAEERGYLNGPKLSGDRGHSVQGDIDAMFVRD